MLHRAPLACTLVTNTVLTGVVWAGLTAFAHAQERQEVNAPTVAVEATPAPHSTLKIEPIIPINEDFQRGIAAESAGQDRDAIAAFQAAYAQDHNPAALLHIGASYAKLSKPQHAVKALSSYVTEADAARDAQTIAQAKQEIERLTEASGRIGLHLIPEHAKVEIDDEVVDTQHGELLVAPGKHAVKASADGYKPFAQALQVLPGKFTLEIELQRIDTSSTTVALAAPKNNELKAAPMREATDEPEGSAANSCVLKSVCLGPVAALIGPPNLIGGGLHARIGRYLGIGVDYQVLPKMTFSPISVGTSLVSANARVYPFGGAFFLSGGIGYQSMNAEVREGDISVRARTGFPAAMASIGFMGHDGFVLGADLGLLFPLSPMRVSLSENALALTQNGVSQADIDEARDKAESQVNKALNAMPLLVQVNLLRLGYMF